MGLLGFGAGVQGGCTSPSACISGYLYSHVHLERPPANLCHNQLSMPLGVGGIGSSVHEVLVLVLAASTPLTHCACTHAGWAISAGGRSWDRPKPNPAPWSSMEGNNVTSGSARISVGSGPSAKPLLRGIFHIFFKTKRRKVDREYECRRRKDCNSRRRHSGCPT